MTEEVGKEGPITLHGGPAHGTVVYLSVDNPNLDVLPVRRRSLDFEDDTKDLEDLEIIQEGQYSRVGDTNDFEWDGWDVE